MVGFQEARVGFGVTNHYKGLVHYLISAVKQEGLTGLYKGVSWALLKSGISTGMYFYFYEYVCSAVRLYKHSSECD